MTRPSQQITLRVPRDVMARLDAFYSPGTRRTDAILAILRDRLGVPAGPVLAAPIPSPPPFVPSPPPFVPSPPPFVPSPSPSPPVPGAGNPLYRYLPPPDEGEIDNPYTAYTGPES